jgi:hypothetical protein
MNVVSFETTLSDRGSPRKAAGRFRRRSAIAGGQ